MFNGSPCLILWSVVGRDLSLSFLCLGVSRPNEESDSLKRVGPTAGAEAKDCKAGQLPEGPSRDVSEADASVLRLMARLGVRNRSKTGGDWVGSAESLSELVSAEEEDPDSGVVSEDGCPGSILAHSPFNTFSEFAAGKGTEFELREVVEGRLTGPLAVSESGGTDIASEAAGTEKRDRAGGRRRARVGATVLDVEGERRRMFNGMQVEPEWCTEEMGGKLSAPVEDAVHACPFWKVK